VADGSKRLLILGDSHSIALKDGCDALGIPAHLLSLSANFWHGGYIVPHRRLGLWARGALPQTRIVETLRDLDSPALFGPDIFVIATFGFHLGRVVPPFSLRGHLADSAEFDAVAESQFASSALIAAYAAHHRGALVALMRRIARRSPMVLVTPPRLAGHNGNYRAFFEEIKSSIIMAGVPLYDPCADLFPETCAVPAALVMSDNLHGTPEYGARVIAGLLESGLMSDAAVPAG